MGIIVRADEMMATDKFIGRDGDGEGEKTRETFGIFMDSRSLLRDTNWGILLSDLFLDKG